ncbi:MAG: ATP phosphoribosyltransferase regulatory subunit [Ethanoligenens sp.]|uniref:ATP phosphoribosyltransferase regulatory subunit n=1 Tax=Ethanoligenens sp. TaxID=2099655 RepID=UPI0039EB1650
MAKYRNVTPDGAYDLLFKECEARRNVETKLVALFRSHGFSEVVTPSLEFYDVFRDSTMEEETMYKLIDARGRILALRPDNTTPIARVASTKLKGFAPPLRLFYNQNVFRISPSMSGRRDEIAQCGVELIGVGGERADIDAISMAITALSSVAPNFRFEIGHVGFFKTLIDDLPVSVEVKERIRGYIDSKSYASISSLLAPYGCESAACRALTELPHLFGGDEVLERALEIAPNEQSIATIRYLKAIYDTLCDLGWKEHIMIDLGLVQSIDYYTGVVFKGYMHGSGEPVLFGGRYDDLYGKFGSPMPATGFALNVDAIARAGMADNKSDRADVLVFYEKGHGKAAFAHVEALIASGLVCERSVFDTPEESVDYARKKGISRIDIVTESVTTQILEAAK